MNIGEIIKINRTKKAMSQAELAEVLHISAQSVSKWENGSSMPDINQLPSIASFFGITIDDLAKWVAAEVRLIRYRSYTLMLMN